MQESFRAFIAESGPLVLRPYRRLLIALGWGFFALAALSVIIIFLTEPRDTPDPVLGIAIPLLLWSGHRLLVGARFTEIVVNADGISVGPNGPRIPASEIRTMRTSGSHLGGRVSLTFMLRSPRWIFLFSPIAVFGRRGEITARLG